MAQLVKRFIATAVFTTALAACFEEKAETLADLELKNGQKVAALVSDTVANVIIAFSPGHCFSCDRTLSDLLAAKQPKGVVSLRLATKLPTPGEMLMLRMRRIALNGVLLKAPSETLWVEVMRSGRRIASLRNPAAIELRRTLTETVGYQW